MSAHMTDKRSLKLYFILSIPEKGSAGNKTKNVYTVEEREILFLDKIVTQQLFFLENNIELFLPLTLNS